MHAARAKYVYHHQYLLLSLVVKEFGKSVSNVKDTYSGIVTFLTHSGKWTFCATVYCIFDASIEFIC